MCEHMHAPNREDFAPDFVCNLQIASGRCMVRWCGLLVTESQDSLSAAVSALSHLVDESEHCLDPDTSSQYHYIDQIQVVAHTR